MKYLVILVSFLLYSCGVDTTSSCSQDVEHKSIADVKPESFLATYQGTLSSTCKKVRKDNKELVVSSLGVDIESFTVGEEFVTVTFKFNFDASLEHKYKDNRSIHIKKK